jgi:hypothetical protein
MGKEKEKKINPPNEVPSQKKMVMNTVKRHLMMKISIPFFVILIFLSLFVIRTPYTAKEKYTDLQPFVEEVTKVIEDRNTPVYARVCEQRLIPTEITASEKAYGMPYGLNDFKCYGKFKVINKGDADGEWTVRYLFNISGRLIQTEMLTQKIPKYTSFSFKFETNDCKQGDMIDGTYQIVTSPSTESCKYETQYNKTIVVNETRQKEVQRERIITKYETLWQKLIGYNRYEKI